MSWLAEPETDHLIYEREKEKQLSRRPICSICGEPITEEKALYLEGWVCDSCLKDNIKTIEID